MPLTNDDTMRSSRPSCVYITQARRSQPISTLSLCSILYAGEELMTKLNFQLSNVISTEVVYHSIMAITMKSPEVVYHSDHSIGVLLKFSRVRSPL